MSYLRIGYDSTIGGIIYEMTEPVLNLGRVTLEKLGLNKGMFDFSYIVAIFYIRLFQTVVARILLGV